MHMDPTSKTILIVEDDQVLLRMLANMLTQHHFAVLEAKNGIEGIEVINEKTPDLILLDVDMPKMDGITMLKRLHEGGKKISVMMLTNLNNPNLIADAAELGVTEYLVKSDWEIDEIVQKVEQKLGKGA